MNLRLSSDPSLVRAWPRIAESSPEQARPDCPPTYRCGHLKGGDNDYAWTRSDGKRKAQCKTCKRAYNRVYCRDWRAAKPKRVRRRPVPDHVTALAVGEATILICVNPGPILAQAANDGATFLAHQKAERSWVIERVS